MVFLGAWLNRIPLAALAAVLIVVGYKLSSRKIILDMWQQGWTQFLPFAITLTAIIFTDLLVGIGIGFLVGIFFVVRSNYHSAITIVNQDENWLLRFKKDLSFIHKSELKRALRAIPDGSHVIVDGTNALYVDGDIYETFREFDTGTAFRGIEVEYHNFHDKQLVKT